MILKQENSYTGDVVCSKCNQCGAIANFDMTDIHECSLIK